MIIASLTWNTVSHRGDFDVRASPIADAGLQWLLCVFALMRIRAGPRFFANWATTQGLTLSDQLRAGSRYFDVRAVYDAERRAYVSHHTLLGRTTLDQHWEALSAFMRRYPREVVLVEMSYDTADNGHVDLAEQAVGQLGVRCTDVEEHALRATHQGRILSFLRVQR